MAVNRPYKTGGSRGGDERAASVLVGLREHCAIHGPRFRSLAAVGISINCGAPMGAPPYCCRPIVAGRGVRGNRSTHKIFCHPTVTIWLRLCKPAFEDRRMHDAYFQMLGSVTYEKKISTFNSPCRPYSRYLMTDQRLDTLKSLWTNKLMYALCIIDSHFNLLHVIGPFP